MPLKLQMEWRHAQMGQLSRMITGSDAGWRGELTADIDVIGSLESAQTKTRLRATGVRREEFAPDYRRWILTPTAPFSTGTRRMLFIK